MTLVARHRDLEEAPPGRRRENRRPETASPIQDLRDVGVAAKRDIADRIAPSSLQSRRRTVAKSLRITRARMSGL